MRFLPLKGYLRLGLQIQAKYVYFDYSCNGRLLQHFHVGMLGGSPSIAAICIPHLSDPHTAIASWEGRKLIPRQVLAIAASADKGIFNMNVRLIR